MDLFKAIQELYEEKKRLDEVIARLEALSQVRVGAGASGPEPPVIRRRGRRSMSETERAEVSQRMKEFWALKRGVK